MSSAYSHWLVSVPQEGGSDDFTLDKLSSATVKKLRDCVSTCGPTGEGGGGGRVASRASVAATGPPFLLPHRRPCLRVHVCAGRLCGGGVRSDQPVQGSVARDAHRHSGLADGPWAALGPHRPLPAPHPPCVVQVLSDELVRMDAYLESVVKKVERQLFESYAAAQEFARVAVKDAAGAARAQATPAAAPPQLTVGKGTQPRPWGCDGRGTAWFGDPVSNSSPRRPRVPL